LQRKNQVENPVNKMFRHFSIRCAYLDCFFDYLDDSNVLLFSEISIVFDLMLPAKTCSEGCKDSLSSICRLCYITNDRNMNKSLNNAEDG